MLGFRQVIAVKVEEYFPDEDRIDEYVNTLGHIFQNQNGMKVAISKWEENQSLDS